MTQTSENSTLESLPEVLTPEHVKVYLDIGRDNAYELFNSNAFHVVKVGRRKFVHKDVFVKWLLGNEMGD
ncbi:helix-turn-helix domain-containing protein [Paenibacillus alvei]|uniref:helix-turn-helix domain-containing protein n=1 Tax=Paenibacillus alvei TaxID=44250 RepID=UPI000289248C|nr:helix-turn-helix domain-containing protein [Paenibacillus alvei]EJW17598.1 hypothetical protein PAV_3c00430 [Paenibacillus alvei DSM 29]MCY9540573.1 helix-turn-helix domain-containing protein [Paenibacillus alvei]MCY9706974.1 helix-turn-helix domain-containing protein [Paenibacillus alvei]MCY9736056.1 helix-turn-helix domain-containing protein [Paenibacillus alvei]MCY9755880.1 helix-turn-helix domain-containing protein [Paenibacillus alvei]